MKEIKILGPGCRNCHRLEQEVRKAVEHAGIEARIDKVVDYAEIASYGVLATPGLVIDGEVVSSGKVLAAGTIARMLTD